MSRTVLRGGKLKDPGPAVCAAVLREASEGFNSILNSEGLRSQPPGSLTFTGSQLAAGGEAGVTYSSGNMTKAIDSFTRKK